MGKLLCKWLLNASKLGHWFLYYGSVDGSFLLFSL